MVYQTTSYIQALTAELQEKLNLNHWRVETRLIPKHKMNKSLMRITPTRNRNYALLEVSASLTNEVLSPLIIHELLHLMFDRVVESHELKETKSFDNEVERTIEHLAHVIANLME